MEAQKNKSIFTISHIILIVLILIIYFYGNSTMLDDGITYTMDDSFMNRIGNQQIIKRSLFILLLIDLIVCMCYTILQTRRHKWLYLIFVLDLIIFGCTLLIFIYSFMFM